MKKGFFYLIILLICLNIKIESAEYKGEYEIGYIGIKINKIIDNDFFPVYMDYKNEEPYMGMMAFFTFIGAENMKFYRETLEIKGRMGSEDYVLDLNKVEYILGEKEVFVRMSDFGKIMEVKNEEWDLERYIYSIEFEFKTPYETFLESEARISAIGENGEENIAPENIYNQDRKLMTPGILRLRYTNFDVSDSDYGLSVRYDTSLLYGDFTADYRFEPESELANISLKYNDVIENKSIVIGDTFPRTYNFLNTSRVRGISIEEWDPNGKLELSNTEIKGFAPFRSRIELYRNNNLIDFTTVGTDNTYEFKNIRIQSYQDVYQVKIYTYEGTIETRTVSVYTGEETLEKGELDYEAFVGKSPNDDLEDKDEAQYRIKGYYGVTDRLTLGAGYMNIVSQINEDDDGIFDSDLNEDDEDDDTIESLVSSLVDTSIYYTAPPMKYPVFLEYSNLYDTDESEYTHIGKYRQRFGDHFLNIESYTYGDKMSIVTEAEEEYELSLRGPVRGSLSYALTYNQIVPTDEDELKFITTEGFYIKNRSSHTLGLSAFISGNDEFSDPVARYEYSNSGLDIWKLPISLTMSATVNTGNVSEDALYSIGLVKRGDRRSDVSFRVDYDTEDIFLVFSVSYKLTDWLELLGEINKFGSESTEFLGGVDIEKAIILEKPFEKTSNPDSDTAWLEGQVYVDTDADGERDADEMLLEGVGVKVGRNEVITDEKGRYFIDGISSYGEEKLEISSDTIDPLLKPSMEKEYLNLFPARGDEINVPLQPISVITGAISFDYEDFSEIEAYSVIYNLYVILKSKDGKVIQEKRIEPEMFYLIEEVLPGEYAVELKYRGSKKVTIEDNEFHLIIEGQEYGNYYDGMEFKITGVEEE